LSPRLAARSACWRGACSPTLSWHWIFFINLPIGLLAIGLGALALAMIAAFGVYESRIENPIVPLRVLRSRSLTGANIVRGLLVIGMFSSFFLGALYLEHVLDYSAVQTGLAFMPMTLSIGALSVAVTPRLLHRFGAKQTLIPGPGPDPGGPDPLRPHPGRRDLLARPLLGLPPPRPRRRHLLHAPHNPACDAMIGRQPSRIRSTRDHR